MSSPTPLEFAYRDKKLGDSTAITFETAPNVFFPTSTTVLLLRAARQNLKDQPARTVLDLGCGCGVVAVVLASSLGPTVSVCASDVSAEASRLAQRNAERNGVTLDSRCGSLFDPWAGQRFDLIVDDVAGVAEPVDRLSGWYPGDVPSGAGPDGTRWINEVLDRAPSHLEPEGRIIFPVVTLSREASVLDCARARFRTVRQLEEQWYPLSDALALHMPVIEGLAAEGRVRLERRGSRLCWATMIYVAEGPR